MLVLFIAHFHPEDMSKFDTRKNVEAIEKYLRSAIRTISRGIVHGQKNKNSLKKKYSKNEPILHHVV